MEKKPSQVVPEKCIGFKVEGEKLTEVTANNAILYSLGKFQSVKIFNT